MQRTSHLAWFLGVVPNVTIATAAPPSRASPSPKNFPNNETEDPDDDSRDASVRPSEIQLIDRIEAAQLEGRLPYSSSETASEAPSSCKLVSLALDKHGVKISDAHTEEVLDRLPLYAVSQAVVYEDGDGHSNVVLKVGGKMSISKNMYTCYVFQTRNQDESVRISRNLEEIFETVLSSQSSN